MLGPKKIPTRDGFVRGTPAGRLISRRRVVCGLVLLVLVMASLSQIGETGLLSWLGLRTNAEALRVEVAELEVTNAELSARLDAVRNHPPALEKLARERHNMRLPEEEVLLVIPADQTQEKDENAEEPLVGRVP